MPYIVFQPIDAKTCILKHTDTIRVVEGEPVWKKVRSVLAKDWKDLRRAYCRTAHVEVEGESEEQRIPNPMIDHLQSRLEEAEADDAYTSSVIQKEIDRTPKTIVQKVPRNYLCALNDISIFTDGMEAKQALIHTAKNQIVIMVPLDECPNPPPAFQDIQQAQPGVEYILAR